MADNHPFISLDDTPNLECPNPVYNCVQYCFTANDFIVSVGTVAFFSLVFTNANKADGIPLEIAGENFQTGTPTTFEQFQMQDAPPLTRVEIAANFAEMLRQTYKFPAEYTIEQLAAPLDYIVLCTAKDVGFQENFDFDLTAFSPPQPPVAIPSNGTDKQVLPDYQLIVQIWLCDGEELLQKISEKAYSPDQTTAQVCIDISGNVRSLVSTTFPQLLEDDATVVEDETIEAEICLRYGQAYDVGLDCDIKPQHFEPTTPIKIINSVFQKDDTDGFAPFCYNDVGSDAKFMTNKPDDYAICNQSHHWFWYHYQAQDLADSVTGTATVFYLFQYVDGGAGTFATGGTLDNGDGTYIIPYGLPQIEYLADPLREVISFTMAVVIIGTAPVTQIPISRVTPVAIDRNCCGAKEFYFLNPVGGYDTIFLNDYQDIDLNISSAEFIGYESCEGGLIEGGRQAANVRGQETFTCYTKYSEKYIENGWLREFLVSPSKYIKGTDGKVRKIRMTTESFPVFRFDGDVFIRIDFVYSYDINIQQI